MRTKNLENIKPGKTICSVCNILKENKNFSFYTKRKTKDGYRLMVNTNCSECTTKRRKEIQAIKKRFKHLKEPNYGEKCECCGKEVYRNWQLDHCHETGEFRGWICKQCNTGLGQLGDNLQSVQMAVKYLERAEKKQNTSQKELK